VTELQTRTKYGYDAPGNLNSGIGVSGMSYNAENQLVTAAGVTYKYDGDGKRVQKSSGKLYWYGESSDAIDETDLSGNLTNEYVFFGGTRIARRDPSNNVFYYFTDHLGTSRTMAQVLSGQSTSTLCYDADFYPFGVERTPILNSCSQNYKFTSKERDSESLLDNFGARYYSSNLGRFMSPDEPLMDQEKATPQSWNLYSYVRNNPVSAVDPNGHDCVYLDNSGGTDPNGPGGASIDHNSSQTECNDTHGFWANGTVENLSWVHTDSNTDKVFIFSHYKDVVGQTWAGPGWSQGDKYANLIPQVQARDESIEHELNMWIAAAFNHGPGVPPGEDEEAEGFARAPVGRRGRPLNMGPEDESLPPTNSATAIGGRRYSGHALDGMQKNGLTPMVVEEVIAVGTQSPGNTPGTIVHQAEGVHVVTNQSGGVVEVRYGPK
jgi:RHS repeat-associated protein